jgi:predicted ArsR family transcriptional regulator
MFRQYPLVKGVNVRVQRGSTGFARLVRALGEPTRREVYLAVERAGRPVTRADVAHTLGIMPRLAAFHLDKLADEGLLDVHHARPPDGPSGPGTGRPPKWYRPSGLQFDITIPPRRADLAAQIMALALEQLGPHGAHREALIGQARACGHALASQLPEKIGLRERLIELGYEPVDRPDGTVELRNCPFHPIVMVARETACTINHALLAALTEAEQEPAYHAVLEPAEGRCCVLLEPSTPAT